MRRRRVYEVCLNVFSTYVFSVCILELRVTHAKYSHARANTHTQASTIVEFGELGVRGALGFSLLTCTFDAIDIVRLIKHFQIIHVAQSSTY